MPKILNIAMMLSLLGCDVIRPASPSVEERTPGGARLSNCAPIPPPSYRVAPADLNTSVDPHSLELILEDNSGKVPEEVIAELQENVELVSWPSKGALPFSVLREPPKSAYRGQSWRIVPTGELAEGWYAISISASLAKSVPQKSMVRDGERYISRFRIGSQLLVIAVTVAEKRDGATMVYLELSEPSWIADVPEQGLQLSSRTNSQSANCIGPNRSYAGPSRRLSLRCASDRISHPEDFRLNIGSGIKTIADRELASRSIDLVAKRTADGMSTVKVVPHAWE